MATQRDPPSLCTAPGLAIPVRQVLRTNGWRRGHSVVLAAAPGRLDVLGGIADYSGATVLKMPLALRALVGAQLADDACLSIRAIGPATPAEARAPVSLPLASLAGNASHELPTRLLLTTYANPTPYLN